MFQHKPGNTVSHLLVTTMEEALMLEYVVCARYSSNITLFSQGKGSSNTCQDNF